ncbi:MAG: hypothetical protein M1837_002257 [Sclerophora amabilis]|nr:MAG: hypothetical protein M1837_002257 [Sclerophora amabilis]
MGREVLLPLGLVGLGCTSIDHCGDEIRQILEIIILSPPSGLLIHCTQGKDRTGLIVVLILFLLDVPIDAIANDYALSESELRPESEERTKALIEIGLTAESAGAPVDWPKSIRTHVVEKYGGISEYLAHIGVNWDMQLAAKRNLARRQDES